MLVSVNPLAFPQLAPSCAADPLQVFQTLAVLIRGSPVSTSSHRAPDSTSALRPSGFTLAQRSLGSTTDCHTSGFARLSRPSDLTVFYRHSGSTSDFRVSGFALILHPSGSLWFSHCPRSVRVPAGLPSPCLRSVAPTCGSTLALRTFGVTLVLQLFGSALVPFLTVSASVSRPPGFICAPQVYVMAPPSFALFCGASTCLPRWGFIVRVMHCLVNF